MSLKWNIIASYLSQGYTTLIGILMVPAFVRYMGAEAYGLVGFFAMAQAWFLLLDIGLTPTISRETAVFQAGAMDALTLRRLVRLLEGLFLAIALLGSLLMLLGSGWIAGHWLRVQTLPHHQVQTSLLLMAFIVVLRWIGGLYRGIITGFEELVWLGAFNGIASTLRFVAVLAVFKVLGTRPTDFFAYQLGVALLETSVLIFKAYALLPKVTNLFQGSWDWTFFKNKLRFSLGIAFTGSIWVLVTQTDKLVLSKLLNLSDYGAFNLAVLVAGGVTTLTAPVSSAILPRLSKLQAEGNSLALLELYRTASQGVALITFPVVWLMTLFSGKLIFAWTGNPALASQVAPILALYAMGNGILAVTAFPYYLQFAKGDLRLHVLGNGLFVIFLIPSLILATLHFGSRGAGMAWLLSNLLYLLLWVPLIHRRLAKGLNGPWFFKDILPIVLAPLACSLLMKACIAWPSTRLAGVALLVALTALFLGFTVCVSTLGRRTFRQYILKTEPVVTNHN